MSYAKLPHTLLVFLFVLPLMSAIARAQPPPSLPDTQFIGALGTDLLFQSGSTGMVLVVVRDEQVFFRGYCQTAPTSHQIPTQDSLLRLCSLTRIFTTDVLTKLVADKTVRLQYPLQRYAPASTIAPKRVRPITLADMATNTSDLPRELRNAPPNTPYFTFPDYRTAGAGCKTNVSAALPVPPPASTRMWRSISSPMPSGPLHTSNTPHFLPSALSTRSKCGARRSFQR